ncbi:MAG: hypothetical protein VX257_09650, partial [Planctomycetota bacterium]|nr:hypothetical protein [Planctomycetota bacterium]
MFKRSIKSIISVTMFILVAICLPNADVTAQSVQLKPGDHICYIGNTTADRMQHHAWLETFIHAKHPKHGLIFRNLGFPGDELKTRSRSN